MKLDRIKTVFHFGIVCKSFLFAIAVFALSASAGMKEMSANISFSKNIAPAIQNKCAKCHSPGQFTPYFVEGCHYCTLLTGEYLVPFHAEKSSVYILVKENHSEEETFSPQELKLLEIWINEGAKNN